MANNFNLKQLNPAEQLAEQNRQRKAVAAVVRGYSYAQAAEAAGYANKSGAYKAVQRALARGAEDIAHGAARIRALEVARLDRMLVELSNLAYAPNAGVETKLKALEAMRRNVETRARILGLNAPIQHEVFTHDALDLQIAQLSERLGLPVPERIQLQLGSGPAGQDADPEGTTAP